MKNLNPILFVFFFIITIVVGAKALTPSILFLLFFAFYIGFPVYLFSSKLKRQKNDLAEMGITKYFKLGRYHSGLTLDRKLLVNNNILLKKSIIFVGQLENNLVLFCQNIGDNPFVLPDNSIHVIEKINYENLKVSFLEKYSGSVFLGKLHCISFIWKDDLDKDHEVNIHVSKQEKEKLADLFQKVFKIEIKS